MSGKQARQRRRQDPVIHEPGPWAPIVDEVNERARLYYETHPDTTAYVRPRTFSKQLAGV